MVRIGDSIKRNEDPILLRGMGNFVADINHVGQIYMKVVRSNIAFGKIRNINIDLALQKKGIINIWTSTDFINIPKIKFRMMGFSELENYQQPILAKNFVRYVGEPIAVIFATAEHLAEEAENLIEIEIETLPAQSSAIEKPLYFDDKLKNDACTVEKEYGNVENASKDSQNNLTLSFYVGRHSGVPLETRGLSTSLDLENNVIYLHGAAKVPHANKIILGEMLNLDPFGLELIEGHVGGGFGVRGEIYPEDVLIILATKEFKLPIKWIESRKENLISTNHSRDQKHITNVGFDDRGFINYMDCEFFTDQGAYIRTHGITVSELTASMLPGPYLIPNYRCKGHVRLTNKTPSGTYRSPGRFESTFVRERVIDAVAKYLGKSPNEVRKINFIPPNLMPYKRDMNTLGTEIIFDSGDYPKLLENALAQMDITKINLEVKKRKKEGEIIGVGFGYFIEKSGLGPFDDVKLRVNQHGSIQLITGVASIGQGVETAMAQIICDRIGTNMNDVTVVHGNTELIERGMGAFATRVTVMTGSATLKAVNELRKSMLRLASKKLQQSEVKLIINNDNGCVELENTIGGPSIPVKEILKELYEEDRDNEILATFESAHMTYPHGLHFAVVNIDRLTWDIKIEKYCVFYDVGRSVNPLLLEGQIVGGVAQGIGGTLFEEFKYDNSLQPASTSFVDYKIPTCKEMPYVDCYIYQNDKAPGNPLGVKGAGEAGINAVGATIASAIDDAFDGKINIDTLPVTPNVIKHAKELNT